MPAVPLPVPAFARLQRAADAALPGPRLRRALLWAGVAAAFAALVVYHAAVAAVGTKPAAAMRAGADLGAALAVAGLYAGLARTARFPHDPVRALWTPLLLGGLGLAGLSVLVPMLDGPGPLLTGSGLPDGFAAVVQAALIAALQGTFAVLLLLHLRALVLFKRTRSAVRRWQALLASMAATALLWTGLLPADTEEKGFVYVAAGAVTVALMLANAFRLSWIVYLPLKRKVALAGLALALIGLLVGALLLHDGADYEVKFQGNMVEVPLARAFSPVVAVFFEYAVAFGILYAITATLSLLFHLPTTSDFRQKTGELEAFQALSSEVLDRQQLADTIVRAPLDSAAAEATWLALVDPRSGSLAPRVVAARGPSPAFGAEAAAALCDVGALAEDALGRGAPLVLQHAAADHRVRASPRDGVGSLVVLPLASHGAVRGALFAARAVPEAFEREDVAGLATFAGQAALALQSADLVAERLERERLARELAIARDVQRRLLPQRLPALPGLGLAAESRPAQEVCGDYYDAVRLGEGCVGLIVGDVAGKGTSAAFYMAELKGIFQAAARLSRAPAEFLRTANEALAPTLGPGAFISAVYAVVDADAGTATIARAGHCPAVLARADGTVLEVRSRGIGLGLDAGPLFAKTLEERRIALRPGDALVLYSDGLVESRSPAGEEYGYARLAAAVACHRHLDADALRRALMDDLRGFTERDADDPAIVLDDDLTLLVARWDGAPAAGTAPNGEARKDVATIATGEASSAAPHPA